MLSRMRSRARVTSFASMTTVEDDSALLSSKINSDVAKATADFKTMKDKFRPLLLALKAQHAAMIDLNKCRLETVQHYESFVSNTPLEPLAVSGDVLFVSVEDGNQEKDEDKGATYLQLDFQNNEEMVKETAGNDIGCQDVDHNDDSKPICSVITEEKEETNFNSDAAYGRDMNDSEDEASLEKPNEEKEETSIPNPESEISNSKPAASAKSSATKSSFTSLHRSVYDFNIVQEEKFAEMIEYTEQWIKTVSSRIEANLVQFEDLKNNLENLSQKVNSLTKAKSVGRKATEKLAQNKIKLRGAQEVHDSFGESLFLQLDEVTSRAWKDFYPLLVKAFDFDVNYSASEAKIFSDLEMMLPKLLEIGTEHNLEVSGRLEDLEKCQPWEFYTGDKDFKVDSRVKRALKTK